jgi:hypothetical protein
MTAGSSSHLRVPGRYATLMRPPGFWRSGLRGEIAMPGRGTASGFAMPSPSPCSPPGTAGGFGARWLSITPPGSHPGRRIVITCQPNSPRGKAAPTTDRARTGSPDTRAARLPNWRACLYRVCHRLTDAKEIAPFLLTEIRHAGTVPGYRSAGGLQRRRVLDRHYAARAGPCDSSVDTDIFAIKAVGQDDDDDDRNGGVPGQRRAGDRPRNQHLDVGARKPADVGARKPVDVGARKPVDVGARKPVDVGARKPVDVGARKPASSSAGAPLPFTRAG